MPEEGFLRRWARVKATGGEAVAETAPAAAPVAPVIVPAAAAQAPHGAQQGAAVPPPPTLAEAAQLTPASDFSAFVGQGVDKDVRRLALKKLFADPHFHVMDRLDMYMDDYNLPSPVSAAMLAGLEHARSALRRPEEVQAELARLAALDPPEHAAGVVAAVSGEVAAVPVGEPALDEAEDVKAEELPLAGEHAPENVEPDSLVQFEPLAATPLAAGPVTVEPDPAAGHMPVAIESDKDAIALTIVRAHNGEARA